MQTTNNKYKYIAIIGLIMIISLVSMLYIFKIKDKGNLTEKDAKNETKYGEIISEDVAEKPFISSLPIKTDYYTVIYSSLNKKIVVIFKNSNESLDILKSTYQVDIVNRLKNISVDEITISNISWEKEKN